MLNSNFELMAGVTFAGENEQKEWMESSFIIFMDIFISKTYKIH